MRKTKTVQIAKRFIVGDVIVDCRTGRLSREGEETRLEPQLLEFLKLLLEHPDEVVSKGQMQARIWSNRHVSDDAVRAVVKKLRMALRDDARDPRYLRTVPLRGYTLVAPVCALPTQSTDPWRRSRGVWLSLSAAALVLAASLWWGSQMSSRPSRTPQLEALTRMQGSEVFADYHEASRLLVYGHRRSTEAPIQLYVKNLANHRVQRLTWDDANYGNAVWSPDGRRLAFTRAERDRYRNQLASYDQAAGVFDVEALNRPDLTGKYVVAWSASGDGLYLVDDHHSGSTRGLYHLALESRAIIPVTTPGREGIGDYFARPSPDGALLAVLRNAGKSNELLVLDLSTAALVNHRVLPHPANRVVWDVGGTRLALSSFSGTLFEYDVEANRFDDPLPISPHFNDVIHRCGDGCYFMRRHNGNFLDIQEQPNPFVRTGMLATDQLDTPDADDLPAYNATGNAIYFVSETETDTLLLRQTSQQPVEQLASLPRGSRITSLGVNDQERDLLGVLNNRVFRLRIGDPEPEFLTGDLEAAGNPIWHPDGDNFYYASLQKGIPQVYLYSLTTGERHHVASGFESFRPVSRTAAIAVNSDLEARLVPIDPAGRPLGNGTSLATLESANPNRWAYAGRFLYFTHRDGPNSLMTRVDTETLGTETRVLARNRFKLNFDVHPDEDRILVVLSLLADSDLVRVQL